MPEGTPTLLRELLRRQHRQPYRLFCAEYDRVARRIDRRLVGTYPSQSTYKRWLRGEIVSLPRSESCMVLEAMFPGHEVAELFELFRDADDLPMQARPIESEEPVACQGLQGAHVDPTAVALTAGSEPSRNVDPELIEYFSGQLRAHYRADMMLGPHDLIGTVSSQFKLVDRLSRAASEPTRHRFLQIGVAYAAFVGWLYQDAGNLGAAMFWRGITQELAHLSRDGNLISYALVNHASARTDLADGIGVVDLCDAALASPRSIAPKVQVMARQQQAHGASLLGDRAKVDDLLDQAALLVDHVKDDLPWGNACLRTPNYIEIQRATCYGRMGLRSEAISLWSQTIASLPATARRDTGVYLARQAVMHADLGEPDRAVAMARTSLGIAQETGSARVRRELSVLRRHMQPWSQTAAGREFSDILAAAGYWNGV